MAKIFISHLKLTNETYGQHFKFASTTGLKMILAGIACLTHACLPWFFTNTASKTITQLTEKIRIRLNTNPQKNY